MASLPVELVRLDLPCDAQAPTVVRHAVGDMPNVGFRTDDVVLIASELVTNAVLHSGGETAQTVEVRISRRSTCLLISVRDPGRSGRSAQLRPGQTVGGWGLQIVAQLAERWGSERDDAGHHVWAEVALSSEP